MGKSAKCFTTTRLFLALHLLLSLDDVQSWMYSAISGRRILHRTRSVALRQGLFDGFSDFFSRRESDFIRLEKTDEEYGPGPAIIFYNVPHGIEDEELVDMLRDGAPCAIRKGVSLSRMDSSTSSDWMDLSLEDALKKVIKNSKDPTESSPEPLTTDAGLLATTPVVFFSGFRNSEMMESFSIISHEVHQETRGRISVACAMAIPNAMEKPLRQVLLEITGDHQEATQPKAEKPK